MRTFVACIQPNKIFYRIESFDQIESMKHFQGFFKFINFNITFLPKKEEERFVNIIHNHKIIELDIPLVNLLTILS